MGDLWAVLPERGASVFLNILRAAAGRPARLEPTRRRFIALFFSAYAHRGHICAPDHGMREWIAQAAACLVVVE